MSGHTPTAEQAAVVDAFEFGADLVVQARAGSGKTSTLKMLAASTTERGVYLAYNKAIAGDAARSFPAQVVCKTAHALAFAAVGRRYGDRIQGPRLPARETARILKIKEPLRYANDRVPLHPNQLGRLSMETVKRFCYSADDEIGAHHVPRVPGIDAPAARAMLRDALLPIARRAWEDLQQIEGRLKFDHDVYLKLWCLSRPQLGADYVLLDEAQDANPAVAALVTGQQSQRILVGDACQSIYGWRGAIDAMSTFDGQQLTLSQSFRFGPQIAYEANKWLTLLGAQPLVTGLASVPSAVGWVEAPDAILCRSNAGAVARAIAAMDKGRSAALVGGAADFKRMAEAALTLKQGLGCDHPELFAFRSWLEVQEYVDQDSSGSDLRVFVDLIDKYGASEVMQVCERLVDEDQADVVISTAHKSKGREWASVTIADDFREPPDDDDGMPGEVAREDAMLAYVAVTRARLQLDPVGLAWVDRHVRWLTEHQPAERRYAGEREQEYASRITTPASGAELLADGLRMLDAAAAVMGIVGPAPTTYEPPADLDDDPRLWTGEPMAVPDTADYQPGDTVLYAGAPCEVVSFEPSNVIPGWLYRVEDAAGLRSWVHGNKLTPLVAPDPEADPEPASAPPVRRCDCGLGEPDAPCGCGSLGVPETEPEPVLEYAGYIVGDGNHDPSGRLLSPDCYQCRLPYQDCTCIMADRRPVEEMAHARATAA